MRRIHGGIIKVCCGEATLAEAGKGERARISREGKMRGKWRSGIER